MALALFLLGVSSPLRPEPLESLDELDQERAATGMAAMFDSSRVGGSGFAGGEAGGKKELGALNPAEARADLILFARRPVIDYYHCVAAHGTTPSTVGISMGHGSPQILDHLSGFIQREQRAADITAQYCNGVWRAMTCHDLSYTLFYLLSGEYFDSTELQVPMAWVTAALPESSSELKAVVGTANGAFAAKQYEHFVGKPEIVAPADLAGSVTSLVQQSGSASMVLNFQVFLEAEDRNVGGYHTWLVLATREGAMMLQAYSSEAVGYTLQNFAERKDTEGSSKSYGEYDGFALGGYRWAKLEALFGDLASLVRPGDQRAVFAKLFGDTPAMPIKVKALTYFAHEVDADAQGHVNILRQLLAEKDSMTCKRMPGMGAIAEHHLSNPSTSAEASGNSMFRLGHGFQCLACQGVGGSLCPAV